MQFKEKPVKAIQWTGTNYLEVEKFCDKSAEMVAGNLLVPYNGGMHQVFHGQVIVKTSFDHFKVMEELDFKFKYEEV